MKIAQQISAYNRERKWNYFKKNIPFDNKTKILDVGFNNVEYSPVDNYLEKKYPFQQNITALGIVGKDKFQKMYPLVNAVLYDGKRFPFEDKSFDICWSNAVIEHVGNTEDQLYFIKEMKRVSKTIIFSTPNKFFPIELHTRTLFLHWLPKSIFDQYLSKIGKKWASGSYMNLLSKRKIVRLLNQANLKNYFIKGNKFLGLSMDYIVVTKP
jgi:SAM-dependent methyltransferase